MAASALASLICALSRVGSQTRIIFFNLFFLHLVSHIASHSSQCPFYMRLRIFKRVPVRLSVLSVGPSVPCCSWKEIYCSIICFPIPAPRFMSILICFVLTIPEEKRRGEGHVKSSFLSGIKTPGRRSSICREECVKMAL